MVQCCCCLIRNVDPEALFLAAIFLAFRNPNHASDSSLSLRVALLYSSNPTSQQNELWYMLFKKNDIE